MHRRSTLNSKLVVAFLSAAFSLLLIPGSAALAGDLPWPCRNGPFQNGSATERDARGVPIEWDEATGKNIAWKVDLEGFGHSTPAIGHGRLWFTAATEDGKQQFVYAIDAQSGRVIHHKLLFENANPEKLSNRVNTYASPSCVLEDDAVYVHFGTYGTARLDPQTATVVWQRRNLHCRHFRGPGSSPVVWQNLIILTFDGIDQQFVTALDKRTGDTVWRTDRSTNYHDIGPDGKPKLEGDLRKAYGTPGTTEVAGRTQLISVGSRAAFGYDAPTGREIWTIPHADFNAAAPPLFFENLAIIHSGTGGTNFMAVRLDESTRGDVTNSHVVWNRAKANSRLCAPVLEGDRIWLLTDQGVLFGLDAKTGTQKAVLRVGGTFVASPLIAGVHLYICDEEGTTNVVHTGAQPKIVATNRLNEGMRASPAVAEGALYLRTLHSVYKIAATKK
jgi:outer membrane protein assembly factor BamB